MPLFDSGTVYLNPDHLLSSQENALVALSYSGIAARTTFDRRTGDWEQTDVYVLTATFSDGRSAEVRVNLEFGSPEAAMEQGHFHAEVIGRAATELRAGLETITIHAGDLPYGGGSNDLLIHTGRTASASALGALEEIMIHELVHITFDMNQDPDAAYIAAQVADGTFPSAYAEEFPLREDRAESFLLYYVLRKHPENLTDDERQIILEGMSNRIAYFDALGFDFGLADGNVAIESLATDQADYLIGGQSDDTIDGAAGADILLGGAGNDILRGGAGLDVINGGSGADILLAAQRMDDRGSNDIAVFEGSSANYDIQGGQLYATVVNETGQRDKLFGFDVLRFDDQDIELGTGSALDSTGDPGDFVTADRVALLYEAALNRDGNIDLPGLNFYISVTERDNLSDEFLAADLMTSPEFTASFGDANTLSNSDFLEQIYLNVLDRSSDTAGKQFYLDLLNAGAITKALALADIAISPENTAESTSILMGLYENSVGEWSFL